MLDVDIRCAQTGNGLRQEMSIAVGDCSQSEALYSTRQRNNSPITRASITSRPRQFRAGVLGSWPGCSLEAAASSQRIWRRVSDVLALGRGGKGREGGAKLVVRGCENDREGSGGERWFKGRRVPTSRTPFWPPWIMDTSRVEELAGVREERESWGCR